MTDETLHAIEKAKKAFAELLLTDIDTAMISLDVSETTRNPETRDAERRTAVETYKTIDRFVDSEKLTPEDSARITEALKPLKSRLDAIRSIQAET